MPGYLIVITIFSIIGICNTLYLTYHKVVGTDVACLFFPDEWCQKVQRSKYSKTLGVPNAIAGLLMYLAVLVFSLLFFYAAMPFWPVTVIVTIGFLFSLYFTFLQAFVLRAFCTWCVLSAIDFVVLAVTVFFYAETLV